MDIKRLPKTEFAAAVAQIAGERNINPQEIIDAIEEGLISAYKRDQKEHGILIGEEEQFTVDLAPESGSFAIFEIDGDKKKNVTPPGFGRIAAMTAKQVIDQKIHEVERDTIVAEYRQKVGTLIPGVILRIDPYKMTVGIGKTEGIFPKDEQIKNELLGIGGKKLFLIKSIDEDANTGRKDIVLSRRDPEFLKQLFSREVPEVGNRTVIVEKIAREAGQRSKVAVSSSQTGIDPVGSCIGQKGSRIQSVLSELPSDEKVDVVAFAKNQTQFIINALSPASDVKVISLKNNLAQVEVPEEQLALAIGAGGENVRLAGILTETDIKVGAAKK
ncbi:MAG: transcription termination factor NusA [Candidatus Shapirobacteria bacterium]|jgi:N utilization substance protein A